MRAAWFLARGELKQRWPNLLLLVVLVAAVGGVTLTAVAGARRTASSYEQFLEETRNHDVIVFGDDVRPSDVAELRAMPGVDAIGYARQMAVVRPGGEFLSVGGVLDDVLLRDVDRLRIVKGRPARPGVNDEVVIGEPLATANRLHVGQTLHLASLTQAQVERIARNEDAGDPAGPQLRLRIVGINRAPLDLSLLGSNGGLLLLPRPVVERYGTRIGDFSGVHGGVLLARLHKSADGVPRFLRQVRQVLGGRKFTVDPAALSTGGVQDSIDLLALAVVTLGAIAATAGLIALGLTLSRQTALTAARQAPVRDLGLPTPARALAVATPVWIAVALGALASTLLAWAASPLLPIGVARRAEIDPGLHFDTLVLGFGTLAILVVVGTIAAAAAWHSTRVPTRHTNVARPSLLTRALDRGGFAPSARIGVRMALEGRAAAVPVRSALAGAGVAALGLVAVSVFGASLQHLHDTPSAFGRPWDVSVVDTQARPVRAGDACGPLRTRVLDDPDVSAVANACTLSVDIDGRAVGAFGITPLRGIVGPTVLAGRAPRAPDEIALGKVTLQALHRELGDHVTARNRTGAFGYRVVGEVAVPGLSDPQAVADGAVLTGPGAARLVGSNNPDVSSELVARFRPGVEMRTASARIRRMPGIGAFEQPGVVPVSPPLEVERLNQIRHLPMVLGGFLALVGAIAVGHLLLTSVIRRRRDFAVLKATGFTQRQILITVSWQATTIAVVGLLVGVALGLVAGAVLWRAIAHRVGVLASVEVPTGTLAAITIATIVIANVVAVAPARLAARTPPAATLRSE